MAWQPRSTAGCGWSSRSPEKRARQNEAAAQREATGCNPIVAEAILRQDPRTEPNRTKKSPAPRFHAVRKWVRKELYQTYTLFVQAYREAAELLRIGNRSAVFPEGASRHPCPSRDSFAVPLSAVKSPFNAFAVWETSAHCH